VAHPPTGAEIAMTENRKSPISETTPFVSSRLTVPYRGLTIACWNVVAPSGSVTAGRKNLFEADNPQAHPSSARPLLLSSALAIVVGAL
jgi:hypothetical protein